MLSLESEILLTEETDNNRYNGNKYFAGCWVPIKYFNAQFKSKVING